jgi:hypothetical protein
MALELEMELNRQPVHVESCQYISAAPRRGDHSARVFDDVVELSILKSARDHERQGSLPAGREFFQVGGRTIGAQSVICDLRPVPL